MLDDLLDNDHADISDLLELLEQLSDDKFLNFFDSGFQQAGPFEPNQHLADDLLAAGDLYLKNL